MPENASGLCLTTSFMAQVRVRPRLMADDVAHVEGVHRQFAISGDDSRGNAYTRLEQRARDLIQETDAVEAFDLDHGRNGRAFIVEIDALRDLERCRTASRSPFREDGARLDLAGEGFDDSLFQPLDAAAIAEWTACRVLNLEHVKGIAVRSGENLCPDDRAIGNGNGAREAREQAGMVRRIDDDLGYRIREVPSRANHHLFVLLVGIPHQACMEFQLVHAECEPVAVVMA